MHVMARVEFAPQRCFLGAYLERHVEKYCTAGDDEPVLERCERLDVWLCLVPMLPIHVVLTWAVRRLTLEEIATDNLESLAEW